MQIEIEFGKRLVENYRFFGEYIYSPRSVLYPGCSDDASPAIGFPDADVTFLDVLEEPIQALMACGDTAIKGNIQRYAPQELHDLLILTTPGMPARLATPHLEEHGYVISDDQNEDDPGITSQLLEDDAFDLVGLLDGDPLRLFAEKDVVLRRIQEDPLLLSVFRKKVIR